MNTNSIEFVPSNERHKLISPWARPEKKSTFDDSVLKPEFKERKLRFDAGSTWMRIVPTIKPSNFDWCMPVLVLNLPGGRIVHPRTFDHNAYSVFDRAYRWIRENHPGSLFSASNNNGVRLLPDPMVVFHSLVEEKGNTVVRVVVASDYDSSRGGARGLGQEIWRAVREVDETGAIAVDAIDAECGRQICVEKTKGKDAKFPSYSVRVGRQPAPLMEFLKKMEPDERAALVPLDQVVRKLDVEEQWECLAKLIAQEHVDQIRASLKEPA